MVETRGQRGAIVTIHKIGEFTSFQEWVNKAQSWLRGIKGVVCVDAHGRQCKIGRDMQRARDEGAFPVSYGLPTRDIPILFSGPMVRGILSDNKTQTRRIVRWRSCKSDMQDGNVLLPLDDGSLWPAYRVDGCERFINSPYGMPKDRLWIRETWAPADKMTDGCEREDPVCIAYQADCKALRWEADPAQPILLPRSVPIDTLAFNWDYFKWRPSIHMPRWASRIQLEVVDVRVERLQDISEESAIAEGFEKMPSGRGYYDPVVGKGAVHLGMYHKTACDGFASLWSHIHGEESWAANPWVWVIEFKRLPEVAHV